MKHIKLMREFDEGWKKFSDEDESIQSEDEVADEVAEEISDDEISDDDTVTSRSHFHGNPLTSTRNIEEIGNDTDIDESDINEIEDTYLDSPLPDDLDDQFEEFKASIDALRRFKNKYDLGRSSDPVYRDLLKRWHNKYKSVIERDDRSDDEKYGR